MSKKPRYVFVRMEENLRSFDCYLTETNSKLMASPHANLSEAVEVTDALWAEMNRWPALHAKDKKGKNK